MHFQSWISIAYYCAKSVSSVPQGQCGSCAAFSVMATLETCFWQMTGVLYDDLSEQHILDCAYGHLYEDDDGYWGADGCEGAWPQAYFDWLKVTSSWHICACVVITHFQYCT